MSQPTERETEVKSNNIWTNIKEFFKKAFKGFMNAKTFWSAFAILIILLIISIVVLSIRLYDYIKVDEREVLLNSTMDESLDIFAIEYANESGEITVKGADGQKVIAPGTDIEYTLRLRNNDKVALNYSFSPVLEHTSEHRLPIVVRLLSPNDDYLIGSENSWVKIDEVEKKEFSGTILKGEAVEYVFQWKWPYESGDDAYDSFLGSINSAGDVGLDVSFTIHSEANTSVAANGGFFVSPVGRFIVILIIAILLAVAITLLLIYIIKKIKAQPEPPAPVVEEPVVEVPEPIVAPTPAPAPMPAPAPAKKLGFYGKMACVNIDTLEELFNDGDRVTIAILKKKGIIPADAKQMKILARDADKLTKALIIETQGVSQNARTAIQKAGGRIIISAPDTGDKKPCQRK